MLEVDLFELELVMMNNVEKDYLRKNKEVIFIIMENMGVSLRRGFFLRNVLRNVFFYYMICVNIVKFYYKYFLYFYCIK